MEGAEGESIAGTVTVPAGDGAGPGARLSRPVLVVVAGHPATGKTTIASRIADACGFVLVAKDEIKERLFDILGSGNEDWSHQLGLAAMMLLYDHAEAVLSVGVSVVMEANFDPDVAGDELTELVQRTGARPIRIILQADPEVIVARYRERADSEDRHPGHAPDNAVDPEQFPPYEPPEVPGPLLEYDCTDIGRFDENFVLDEVKAVIETL